MNMKSTFYYDILGPDCGNHVERGTTLEVQSLKPFPTLNQKNMCSKPRSPRKTLRFIFVKTETLRKPESSLPKKQNIEANVRAKPHSLKTPNAEVEP